MPLTIEVQKITPEGMSLSGALDAGDLDLGCEGVTPAGPLSYSLTAELVGRELLVRGRLRLPVHLVCSRCVKTFDSEISAPRYSFHRTVEEKDIIDLTESVREDMIIGLPLKPLCRKGCRGLCPRCGRDLNVERCSCPPPSGDVRWGALEGLELPPEKER